LNLHQLYSIGDFFAALIGMESIIKVAITQHAIAANPAIGPITSPFYRFFQNIGYCSKKLEDIYPFPFQLPFNRVKSNFLGETKIEKLWK
jgi:hypothetical protein